MLALLGWMCNNYIMKFLKFVLFSLVLILTNISTTIHAEGFIPKEIKFSSSTASYSSGIKKEFVLVPSSKELKADTQYEFGVARQIKNGFITSFDIVTTETVIAANQGRFTTLIPNIMSENATSTYVIYLKSYVKNDPESENFFVTDEFTIIPNESPFVTIKNINLLQSTGDRFEIHSGPTIYNPIDVSTTTEATTTSVEITFDSNTDTIFKPIITFKKLRSNTVLPNSIADEIHISKGLNYVTIQAPTFGYEPGVYMGHVEFENELLQNSVDFQYIVSGQLATVGQLSYTQAGVFTFDVFGTPLDLFNREVLTAPEIHSVNTVFLSNGKKVYATSTIVNFASSTFSVVLPKKIKQVDTIQIEVVSGTTGKVLYTGEKKTDYMSLEQNDNQYILYILLILILIVLAFKKFKIAFIIALIVSIVLVTAHTVFGDNWNPALTPSYVLNSRNLKYYAENYSHPIYVYLSEDITQKSYACGDVLKFMFKVEYINCSNTGVGVQVGFSTTSLAKAEASKVVVSSNFDKQLLESQILTARFGVHKFYQNISQFKQFTGPVLAGNETSLYISASTLYTDPAHVQSGISQLQIPITVGACTACTNAPLASNVPNFKVGARNYYYNSADSALYYRDDNPALNAAPVVCEIDMCSDTPAAEGSIPFGKSWKPAVGSYSTDPNRYACLPVNITCACNTTRDRVCTNSNTGTTSTDIAHSSCSLKKFCAPSYQDKGLASMTFNAYNKKGTLTYIPAGNPVTGIVVPPEGITVTKKMVDSFDGASITASCDLSYYKSVTTNSAVPSIRKFYANPKVVNDANKCQFGWETNNITSCRIGTFTVPVNLTAGDLAAFASSTYSLTSAAEDQNVTVTLNCSGRVGAGPVINVATTTTCYVNPKLLEN